ncbi:calcium-transporting ATPase 12, plasma membrane-type-like [Quercus lobata]|uniref:Calcium-transporting ATPase n=1 Tax=Quercus lobata TaxID=97700 RepID=A0A7N2MC16_QUELO|nr:calcium-transporting ATPase 12, plasma membrane-type-like [Quercus lobata]
MFESTTNQACDIEAQTLGAGLLITTTTISPKYGRIWRKSLYVGLFITQKKTPYDPLPEEPPAASKILERASSVHIDVDDEEHLPEIIAEIVKQRDLNSLKRLGGVDEVLARLRSNLKDGIDGGQDQAWNSVEKKGFFYFFKKACDSYTNVLLLVSAVLSFVTGIIEKGRKDGWHDGVAILVALVLLVAFPSVGNYHHERKMAKKKLKNIEKLEVRVERGETFQWISISKVVVGNIVWLKKGDRVPADGLLVSRDDLVLDEVLKPKIHHEQNPFLFSGSKVIEGKGRMLVTSVGDNTAMGKLLSLVTDQPNEKTVFQGRIDKPSIYMDMIALCVTVLISLVVLIRLLHGNHSNSNGLPELKGNVSVDTMTKIFEKMAQKSKGKIWILTSALTSMVIGIQHGMPFVITVSLRCWKEKVQLSWAHPQNLLACGTMGLVTVIYIDITSGLMCKLVELSKVFVGEREFKNYGDSKNVLEALRQGFDVSLRVSEISVSPTNALLISWAKQRRNSDVYLPTYDILNHKSCTKKGRGALIRKEGEDEKIMHLHWDGAASTILEMCSHYFDSNGETHAIEGQKKEEFKKLIKDMEDGGLIPIAFAYRKTEVQELKEDGLSLLAIVGLKYPCQEEFKSVVQTLRNAGVGVKLVSDDEPSVARAMAFELGIFSPGSMDVDIQKLKTREGMEELDRATVVGSCLPEHKVCMIQCSKQKGHIVAFIGGSTTIDIPALKEADVGIIEETQSTKQVKESSDITLEGYRSLVPVLKFGRCCYHNIQKFIQLQFTACLSGLLISLVMTMVRGESPITGLELAWMNLVLCLLGGLIMKMEVKSEELLTNKPAKRTQSLLTKAVWVNIATQASYQASILLLFQLKGQAITDMNDAVRKTMVFNTFILCQMFNQFNAMDLVKWEVFWGFLQNYSLLLTLTIVIVTQVVLIHYLGSITQFEKLNAVQWTCCFLVAALPLGFDRALRWLAGILSLFLSSAGPLPSGMPSPYVSYLGVPFFTFLLLALPALFTTIINYDENVPSGCK